MLDKQLSEELRRQLVDGIRAQREEDARVSQSVPMAAGGWMGATELFAPVARELRSFGKMFGIRVPAAKSSWQFATTRKLESCVGATELFLQAPEPGAWMSLRIASENRREPQYLLAQFDSESQPPEAGRKWKLEGVGPEAYHAATVEAMQWFADHMGEFVVAQKVPEPVTGAIATERRAYEEGLRARLSASILKAAPMRASRLVQLNADRAMFRELAELLESFGQKNRVRVYNPSSAWPKTLPLASMAGDRCILLGRKSADPATFQLQSLYVGLERNWVREQGSVSVLRAQRSGPGLDSREKTWAIPPPGPARDAVVREAAAWFIGEMAPFVANQKHFTGNGLGQ